MVQKGKDLVRVDVAHAHWEGPPDGAVGWWVSKMPQGSKSQKMVPAPTAVLLDALDRLLEIPDDHELAYLLALLLVRRRILTQPGPRAHSESLSEPSTDMMQLKYTPQDREFVVPIGSPASDRADRLCQRLIDLL